MCLWCCMAACYDACLSNAWWFLFQCCGCCMHIMSVGEQSSLAPLSYPDAATTKITAAATTENPSEQFIMTAAADAATCCVPPAQQRPQACGADSSVQALMGIRNSADAAVCPTSNCIEASGANDMGKAAAVSAATTSTTDLTTAAAQASNSSAPRDRQHSSSPGATAGSSSRDIAATRPTFYSDELHAAVDMPGGSHGMAGCNAGSLPATKRRSTATRTGKHPAHRLSKKARRHDTSVPLPKDARTAGELGLSLLAHGVLLQPVDAFGCHSGQWVADETILRVLAAACSGRAAPFTSGSTHYEVCCCSHSTGPC